MPPVVVRKLGNGGYQVLDNAEAFHAARQLGFKQVPVIVAEGAAAPARPSKVCGPRKTTGTAPVFWGFRVMVGLGLLMLVLGAWSLLARARGKLYDWSSLKRFAVLMGPAGFIAVIAGWITTEVGRQPFTVYGLMRTAESASPLAAPAVGASLVAFVAVCLFTGLGSSWLAGWWWNVASQRLPTSLSGQLIVSETVFALVYSFAWDGTWPTAAQTAAAACFVGGILLSIRAHR